MSNSVLQIAAENHNLDQLLGIVLSERVKKTVGPEWYSKNIAFCKSKESLVVEDAEAVYDIDLF